MRPTFIEMGMSPNMADLLLEMCDALNSGYMRALEPRSARNTTPTSYETFVAKEFVPRCQRASVRGLRLQNAIRRKCTGAGESEADAARSAADMLLSRDLIESTLRDVGGNVSRAAQALGLSRQALYRRMDRFNIRP